MNDFEYSSDSFQEFGSFGQEFFTPGLEHGISNGAVLPDYRLRQIQLKKQKQFVLHMANALTCATIAVAAVSATTLQSNRNFYLTENKTANPIEWSASSGFGTNDVLPTISTETSTSQTTSNNSNAPEELELSPVELRTLTPQYSDLSWDRESNVLSATFELRDYHGLLAMESNRPSSLIQATSNYVFFGLSLPNDENDSYLSQSFKQGLWKKQSMTPLEGQQGSYQIKWYFSDAFISSIQNRVSTGDISLRLYTCFSDGISNQYLYTDVNF